TEPRRAPKGECVVAHAPAVERELGLGRRSKGLAREKLGAQPGDEARDEGAREGSAGGEECRPSAVGRKPVANRAGGEFGQALVGADVLRWAAAPGQLG